MGTVTLVRINQVDTARSVLAGVAVTLLDLDVTDGASVPWVALTREGGNAILTHTIVTRPLVAFINVLLTKHTCKACSSHNRRGLTGRHEKFRKFSLYLKPNMRSMLFALTFCTFTIISIGSVDTLGSI